MNKSKCYFNSLIIAIALFFLYPKTKNILYSEELFDYLATFINGESNMQLIVFGLSLNIVYTLLAAFIAGILSSVIFLSRLNKDWKIYGISSVVIYVFFRYLVLIVRFKAGFSEQNIGVQISYLINPLIAGIALYLSIWVLSIFRQRLPSTENR